MKHIYLLSISLLVLWGCGTENTPTFTLTTTVSPAGSGTILPTQTSFNKGETAVLEAVPNNGWRFVRWEGDLTSTVNPVNLGMTRDYNIIGVFVRADFYETDPITDIDGNVYKTAQIGSQNWIAENLRTSKYRNGDAIPNVTNNSTWAGLSTGAWSHYNNDTANESVYGKLYNWYAVADSRNICPTGWHVPSDAEWTTLSNFLGSDVGFKMKATSGWGAGNGSNVSGFTGLPGGIRGADGTFVTNGSAANFWSSTQMSGATARGLGLIASNSLLGRGDNGKKAGFSVRCIRD